MNILLVTQNYHPSIGGIETHARQVAWALAERHQVSVAAVSFGPRRLPKRLDVLHSSLLASRFPSYRDGSVPVHALTPSWPDRIRMLPIAARAVPRLRRYAYHGLQRFGYIWYRSVFLARFRQLASEADIVHALGGDYLGWAAQAAASELGKPFICTPFVHPKQWGDDSAHVDYYNRSSAVVALLESDRQYLLSIGVREPLVRVIGVSPSSAALSSPNAFRQRHRLGRAPVVLYIGRMTRHKGAEALLAACSDVWRSAPETRFVFVGPPTPESAGWFKGRDPRVTYVGPVDSQEKADALDSCDVFCMPSVSEILPTVYLEAWSCGKPVIGGRAPGLPELIEGNDAGIAVAQDPRQISDAVVRLVRDPELRTRLGRNGQELVRREYSIEAVTGALEALYTQLAAASVPAGRS